MLQRTVLRRTFLKFELSDVSRMRPTEKLAPEIMTVLVICKLLKINPDSSLKSTYVATYHEFHRCFVEVNTYPHREFPYEAQKEFVFDGEH